MKPIGAYTAIAFLAVLLAVTTHLMFEYRATAEDAQRVTNVCLSVIQLQNQVKAEYQWQRDMYRSTLNEMVGPAEIDAWARKRSQ